MIQRGLQSMVPSPLCPPTSEPGGSRPPEDSQLAVSAPGAVCRRKRRGKGWGQAQWPPGPRPWGMEKQARPGSVCPVPRDLCLLTVLFPPPHQGCDSQAPREESHGSSFLRFPPVRVLCESAPEIHLFTADANILHPTSDSTTLSNSTRRCHCLFQRQRGSDMKKPS